MREIPLRSLRRLRNCIKPLRLILNCRIPSLRMQSLTYKSFMKKIRNPQTRKAVLREQAVKEQHLVLKVEIKEPLFLQEQRKAQQLVMQIKARTHQFQIHSPAKWRHRRLERTKQSMYRFYFYLLNWVYINALWYLLMKTWENCSIP